MFRRTVSLFVVGLMLTSLAGCMGGGTRMSDTEDTDRTSTRSERRDRDAERPGMSSKQKLVLLAGAAALAYLYNKHKNRQGTGPEGQYYRSKNGRIYYRDSKGKAIWVTPPSEGIRVTEDEAERYRRMSRDFETEPSGRY